MRERLEKKIGNDDRACMLYSLTEKKNPQKKNQK